MVFVETFWWGISWIVDIGSSILLSIVKNGMITDWNISIDRCPVGVVTIKDIEMGTSRLLCKEVLMIIKWSEK